ncbi:Error-prone repair protein ImuA [Compostibacter hankyongensis]|uniref:ImuA family protein n=1 Tax=Compostibacter hankyongensis TaxID=1007089 RepID=A0ABP8FBD6_9BACT
MPIENRHIACPDTDAKAHIFQKLQKEILALQGLHKPGESLRVNAGLGAVEAAFPDGVFPTGAMHEFISQGPEEAAATEGFMAGLLGGLMQQGGFCLWVGSPLFPPALTRFGIAPEKILFVTTTRPKEILWAVEEGLRCAGLTAVVGRLQELSFTAARRLQLAVEQSRVTGFIHRCRPRSENTIACVARWRIKPLPARTEDALPGVGHPRWTVQLLRARNGKPGAWQLEWAEGRFHVLPPAATAPEVRIRKIG